MRIIRRIEDPAGILNQGPFPPPALPGLFGTAGLSTILDRQAPSSPTTCGAPRLVDLPPLAETLPSPSGAGGSQHLRYVSNA